MDALSFNDRSLLLTDPPGQPVGQSRESLMTVLEDTCRQRQRADGMAALGQVDEQLIAGKWSGALQALEEWEQDYPPLGPYAITDRTRWVAHLERAKLAREQALLSRAQTANRQHEWQRAHKTLARLFSEDLIVSEQGASTAASALEKTAHAMTSKAWTDEGASLEKRMKKIGKNLKNLKKAKSPSERRLRRAHKEARALATEVRAWEEERIPEWTLGRVKAPEPIREAIEALRSQAELAKASAMAGLARRLKRRFKGKMKKLPWSDSQASCDIRIKRISWKDRVSDRLVLEVERCPEENTSDASMFLAFDWNDRAGKFSSAMQWRVWK
jgi:hypothetical protein